jgi:hypothetical protein
MDLFLLHFSGCEVVLRAKYKVVKLHSEQSKGNTNQIINVMHSHYLGPTDAL